MKYIKYSFLILLSAALSCKNDNTEFKTKKEVRIYVAWPGYGALPYYNWPGLETEPIGPEPTLISEILKLKGYTYNFIPDYPYKGFGDPRIESLTDNAADVSIRALTITDSRKKLVDFSDPYFIDGLAVMVSEGSEIKSLKDLEYARISTYSYTTAYNWVKENLPNAIIVTEIDLNIDYWTLVSQNLVDAHITDYIYLQKTKRTYPKYNLKILEEKLTQDPLGIAVRKGNQKLLRDINDALNELKESGRLDEILADYYNINN